MFTLTKYVSLLYFNVIYIDKKYQIVQREIEELLITHKTCEDVLIIFNNSKPAQYTKT